MRTCKPCWLPWWLVMAAFLIIGSGAAWAADSTPMASALPKAETTREVTSPNDQAYEIKLREMEERVNQLKEKIYRSKARLLLLQEKIMHGVLAGSKVVVAHHNTMGSAYRLDSVAYYLDGEPIFGRIDVDGSLNKEGGRTLEVFNSAIQPGNHLLSVYMVYRGASAVFVYVEGIQVKLKSSTTFKAEEGKVTQIDVTGYDEGGVLAKFEDRPAVKFETRLTDLQLEDVKNAKVGQAPAPTAP